MSTPVLQWIVAILQNLIASFFAVLLGLAFAHLVRNRLDSKHYGGYSVRVVKTEWDAEKHRYEPKIKVDRPISVAKAKAILTEPADLSVFLKGVVSPYATLFCDPITELNDLNKPESKKVLYRQGKTFIINLDNNKPPESLGHKDVLEALNKLASALKHGPVWSPTGQATPADGPASFPPNSNAPGVH